MRARWRRPRPFSMLRPSWELSSDGFTLPRPSCVVRWLVCQRVALHQQGEPRRCPDAASAATAWSVACNEAHASPNLPMHTAARRRAFTSVGAVVPPMKLVVTWAALTLLVQPVTASNPKGLHISDEEAQLHFGPNRECTIELKAGPPPYLESRRRRLIRRRHLRRRPRRRHLPLHRRLCTPTSWVASRTATRTRGMATQTRTL